VDAAADHLETKMNHRLLPCVLALAGSLAFAQSTTEDHSAHHPDAAAAAPPAQAAAPDSPALQMQMMRDMHTRMQSRTPAERQALMAEQMRMMRMGGMGGMMGMHGSMEQRMAMMEHMMQMMVDREAAMPRR
jgi:hypothetical protein